MTPDLSNVALDAIRIDKHYIRRAETAIDNELAEDRQPVSYHGKVIDTHARALRLKLGTPCSTSYVSH